MTAAKEAKVPTNARYVPATIVPPRSSPRKSAAAPAPDTVARLEAEIQTLRSALDENAKQRDTTSQELKQVLAAFEGLGDLSEILTMKYNPFLDGKEQNIFDGLDKNKAKLLEGFLSATGNGHEATRADGDGIAAPDAPLELGPRLIEKGAPVESAEPVPEAKAVVETPPPAAPTPIVVSPPPPARRSHLATPRGERTVGGARETYMALCWMHSIQDVIDPQAIHPILEHYRRIEWIDQDVYDWLCGLADGIVERGEGGWDLFDLEPKKRSKLHAVNVAFFDDLFRNHLRPEEREVLERDVAAYFRGF